jgi:hypothetical protein
MKIKSLFIAALVVLNSAVVFAGKEEPVNIGMAIVSVKGSDVFKVIYKGTTSGKVKLNVYNAQGVVVFSDTQYGVQGFIRPLNFSGLSSGEYTIELTDLNGKRTEKVIYSPSTALKQLHVSKIDAEGKFLMALINEGKQDIVVTIYDSNNDVIYSKKESIDGDFAQVYKLVKPLASYTFQVTDKSGNVKTIQL